MPEFDEDELTAEEEKLLQDEMMEGSGENVTDDDEAAAPDPAPDPAPDKEAADAEGGEAKGGDDAAADADDPDYKEFLQKHGDKSPEELAKIAFQQQKRAAKSAFDARESAQRIASIRDAAAKTLADREAERARKKAELDELMQTDPDEALRRMRAEQLEGERSADVQEAQQTVIRAQQEEAVRAAAAAIPEFEKVGPQIAQFAQQHLGYSQEELAGITDARDLISLHFARLAGSMYMAGYIDIQGRFQNMPQNGNGNAGGQQVPQAAQKDKPAEVRTLSSAKGGAPGGGLTADQEISRLAKMSDEDFAKLSDEEVNKILAAAS